MKRIAALTSCLALLIPGAAVASAKSANPTDCSYTHTCNVSQVDHTSASKSPASKKSSPSSPKATTPSSVKAANAARTTSAGSLPFTGLDIGALGAGAAILLGAGMVLRRASTTDDR